MMRIMLTAISLILLSAVSVFAMPAAKDGCGTMECSKCHSLTVKEAAELLSFAGVTVKSVKPAPSHGMHEVLFQKDGGLGIVYIDYGKKHLIQGMIIDLKTKEPAVMAHEKDIPRPKQFTGLDPKLIPAQYAIIMGNPKAAKKLYVFTDPDCPYCRTLHPELQKLEKLMPDLAIHIMLYPLQQLHPQAYDKARVVLSTKSRKNLDLAFEGKELPQPKGDEGKASIDAVIQFAQEQGINGTPMILMTDGTLYQGQRTAEAVMAVLKGQ
ncbi:MAG: DsbC family protein [Geobacteraceae bacterium]|nr:DsbC family protein [Geobacteraceae bacterium]